jgi:hypothetical protein
MKTFSSENTINSGLKYLFIAFWIAMSAYLIYRETSIAEIELHPFLSSIIQSHLQLSLTVVVILRIVFIVVSTYLSYLISVSHFEIPRKDYTIAVLLPVLHFCIPDWNTGFVVSLYWLAFIGMVFLLFPNNFSAPHFRRIMSAALLAGFFLPNGPFALLLFAAGIIMLTVWQNISVRTALIWLTGFLLPTLYLLFYYFLIGKMDLITENISVFFNFDQISLFNYNVLQYAIAVAVFILIVPFHLRLTEYKIIVRRSYSAFLLSIIVLIPAFFYSEATTMLFLSIIGFAAAFYWNKTLYSIRRKAIFAIWMILPIIIPILLILLEMKIVVLPAF